jgi:hypothetical protein
MGKRRELQSKAQSPNGNLNLDPDSFASGFPTRKRITMDTPILQNPDYVPDSDL